LPTDIVQKLCNMVSPAVVMSNLGPKHTRGNVATLSKVTLMSPEDLPSVVVDILDLGVGAFEVRNAILIPGSVITEVLLGQCLCIKSTFEKW